ncbi:hypothetical protein KR215_004334, partial [Drosophila sulfurigaster]
MQKLTTAFSLAALAVLVCCVELLQAAPASAPPADVPSNPVYFKRYHRIRPSKRYPHLDVFEVRELYYVRRATPKPKPPPLTSEQLDQLIRCDFDPTLPECAHLSTSTRKPLITSTTTTTSTSTTTTTTTPTPTTSTTTTEREIIEDIPILPVLPEEPEEENTETETITPEEEEEIPMEPDDETDDDPDYEDDPETNDDDTASAEKFLTNNGSIGGNDVTK